MLTVQAAESPERCAPQSVAALGTEPEKRVAGRVPVAVHGRLIWKDKSGTTRIASVMTRNVSEHGALVECDGGSAIPLYRLVEFHLERGDRGRVELPAVFRHAPVLAAVYRVGPYSSVTGRPESYALRLLVKPQPPGKVDLVAAEGESTPAIGRRQTMTA